MSVIDIERLVKHKKLGYYSSSYHIRGHIGAGTHPSWTFWVPTEKIYIVGKIVHDVEDNIFIHKLYKDGERITPKTTVTGDFMEYFLTEPFIAVNKLYGVIENTDANNAHYFRASIYFLECPARELEREVL